MNPCGAPYNYVAGQWVSLALPVGPTPPLKRAYSMATSPREDGSLVLAFDHVPKGLGSTYLSTCEIGDTLEIHACMGRFTLPDILPPHLFFLAHYTGIVPIRGLIETLLALSSPPELSLVYSSPTKSEFPYLEELQSWTGKGFTIRCFVDPLSGDWMNASQGKELASYARNTLKAGKPAPYIAGVAAFVRPLRALCKEEGYTRKEVVCQRFD